MTGTTGSDGGATAGSEIGLDGAGGDAVAGGDSGGEAAGGVGVGLDVRDSLPLVAQPASSEQQMPKPNQNVADRCDRCMLKNLQGSIECR